MAKRSSYHATPARKAVIDEKAKIAKLREQRLAADAARHAAGTWGDMSVGEIAHEPTGEVFVLSWKGREPPDLLRMRHSRPPELSLAEHERLQAWLERYDLPDFRQSLVGWSLSRVEAKRAKQARIAERRASGCQVINDDLAAA